ncbi:hypothetical protein NB640_09145 [Oxalobacter vibrioformis]|uniref:Uncharacterized protein n=1 Tax=Oxalobacter vibrioformis TaxID=933080 RepID=A0A9E9LUH8_9BURK|nr:hypothetical protein [Oxalobacter vibrioformis]WAW09411.1 hypothetical protein NB640_09145 [Oxalobacter vibrioformis]
MPEMKATEAFVMSKVSWSSVLGGVTTVLATSILFSVLGMAMDRMLPDPDGSLTITAGPDLWSVIALLASFALGGFIAVMQPEFIPSQMANARDDAVRSLQTLRLHPDNYASILSDLIDRLDQRMSAITEDIDQEHAIRGLMKNTRMNGDEARVNLIRLLAEHQQATNLACDVLGEAEGRLRAAQLEIDDILENARQMSETLSRTITRSALGAFFTLVLCALLRSYSGYLGTIRQLSWQRRKKKMVTEKETPENRQHPM